MTFEERTLTRLKAVNQLLAFYEKMTADCPDDMDELDVFQTLIKSTELILQEYREVLVEAMLKNKDYEDD